MSTHTILDWSTTTSIHASTWALVPCVPQSPSRAGGELASRVEDGQETSAAHG